MEIHKSSQFYYRRTALMAFVFLLTPLVAQNPAADRELATRSLAIEEARELLRKGDEAYHAARYGDAVEAFAGARELIPDAPVSAELRKATTERFAQASVELARELSRRGDVARAGTVVDRVLAPAVAPNDPGALAMRAQLDDPIRTNPALTAGHARSVDEVRRLLYTAQGAYDLAKFDEAAARFEDVLRIDPYNTAARRGLERVAAARSGYQESAFDHARAEMLSMVDAAWETPVPPADLVPGPLDPAREFADRGEMTVAAMLEAIMIPRIALDQVTLEEAIDFLRTVARRPGPGGGEDFINFTLNLGPPESEVAREISGHRFSLQLKNVPLRHALKMITEMTRTSFTTDDFAVRITPVGAASEEMVARTYRVPPDFLTSISGGVAGGDAAAADPFAEPARQGLLVERPSVQEALRGQGVSFPEGASASYNAATNTLRVVNTPTNQDFISQIVEVMARTEPVMVSIKLTMIRTSQTNLEELGFDWLVNPFGLSANNMFGSGGTTGNTPGRTGSDFISPIGGVSVDGVPAQADGLVNPGLVTNGLRSGDQGIGSDRLDEIIGTTSRTAPVSVAPGIMGLTGLFSDGQVQMIMRGLDQKKGVDLMAQPAVITRSGQQATVEIIREFIYPTEYEPPELPNQVGGGAGGGGSFPVTPATPTAFEMKPVGMILEVLPVVDEDKRFVDIRLNPAFVEFDGFVNYGSPINSTVQTILGGTVVQPITENAILMPVFSRQQANTQLSIYDGTTMAFGGLITQGIQNVEDKVPVLGDLPLVGRFFSTKARKPVVTSLVFLVRVELLDPTGRPYRDR